MITCKICKIQYVGETKRAFSVRMKEHLSKIVKGDTSQIIYRHFNCDEAHRNMPIEKRIHFQILEKVFDKDVSPLDDTQMRKRRINRELFWISRLRTSYPLGLNDKILGFGMSGSMLDDGCPSYNPLTVENGIPRCHHKRRSEKEEE